MPLSLHQAAANTAPLSTQFRDALQALGPAKKAGRALGVPHRSVERWQAGAVPRGAVAVLRGMRASRAFAAALLRLAGLDEASMAARQAALDEQMLGLLRARAAIRAERGAAHAGQADGAMGAVAGRARDGQGRQRVGARRAMG